MCVLWKLEKKGQGDGVSPDVGREIFQSRRLGTAKFLHLTDEETEAQRDAISHLWSASQAGQSQVLAGLEPKPLDLQAQSGSCSAPYRSPVPSPGGLDRIVCPLFRLVGSSTCPLLGLGDVLTCPLLELVSASLAFVSIGQFSVTLQVKGRIIAMRGEWDRKFGKSWSSSKEGDSHP